MLRNRYIAVLLLLLCSVMATHSPVLAQNVNLSSKAFARLGQAVHIFFDRFAEAATYISKGNFTAKVSKPDFSRDNRKMRLRIAGIQKLPAGIVRHKVVRFFYNETPMPYRSEYAGFLRVFPPVSLEKVTDKTPVKLGYRIDLEINLQECVKIAARSGINFAIDKSGLLESEKLLLPLKKIENKEFQNLLAKLFPSLCNFALNRGINKTLDLILSAGSGKPQSAFKAVGMDDFVSFVTFAAMQGGQYVIAQQVSNLAAGAAGAAVSTIVLPVPIIGEVALGAILVSLAVKNAPALLAWGVKEFQKGIFRDRLGKATMHLMGKYPPGRHQIVWFEKQIRSEAQKDDYQTLHRLLFFLRLQPLSVRRPWKKVLNSYAQIIETRVENADSFKAERYLAVIRFLQGNS